jgi:hypothetical protein
MSLDLNHGVPCSLDDDEVDAIAPDLVMIVNSGGVAYARVVAAVQRVGLPITIKDSRNQSRELS